ncbi:MAG: potassium channel protein [Anaerolineae bacterium]|nr:potassium channel protein [Anaerolineae bacterium]
MIHKRVQRWLAQRVRALTGQVQTLWGASREPLALFRAFLTGVQMRGVLLAITAVIIFGTLGYTLLWGWPLVDALFMTMITVTTVGFGETRALDAGGRLFTMLLIGLSVTVVAYGVSSSVEFIASGAFFREVVAKRQQEMIAQMDQHFIVTGLGRVGQEVARALNSEGIPFIIVEPDPAAVEAGHGLGYSLLHGNATEDAVLEQAGIARARGLICATGDDATNVYIVLTARGLNPDLLIIARASNLGSENKLLRAGADRVISPYTLSGKRMANLALRPFVVDFLDMTGTAGKLEKALEEIVIEEGSLISNRTLGEVNLRQRAGALILGLYRVDGEVLTSPSADTLLEPGTRMIVLGTRDELNVTEALARNFIRLSVENEA